MWQRQRVNKKKKSNAEDLIRDFANREFGEAVAGLSMEEFAQFEQAMLTVMYSNRYKKGDEFLAHIDFSIIRDVLYSYSEEARTRFFDNRWMSMMFHHFYIQGANLVLSKAVDKSSKYAGEQEMELRFLDTQAVKTLNLNQI